MKVYIGPYNKFWTLYELLQLLPILERDRDAIYDFLENSRIHKFLNWFNSFRNRTEYIRIDRYDTWNLDHSLGLIILPALKQLKDQKQGYPLVKDEDVPEELRSTNASPKENEWDWDDNAEKRWDWVIDQMIWSFQQLMDDNWEEQFHSGTMDHVWEKCENSNLSELKHGPNHTHKFDAEGYKAYSARIDNGLKLFGLYYRCLWT